MSRGEYTRKVARSAGGRLDPIKSFRYLAGVPIKDKAREGARGNADISRPSCPWWFTEFQGAIRILMASFSA
jgi:hypothetical protein